MNQIERIYKIENLLNQLGVVNQSRFLEELEVSSATFRRDIEYMRSRFNAPIEWSAEKKGYHFVNQGIGPRFALPGLWLSESEIYALLCMQNLLKGLGTGSLASHIQPISKRLTSILNKGTQAADELEKRIRFIQPAKRLVQNKCFEQIATATISRKKLSILYYTKSTDQTKMRVISPQVLTYYRDNWYADSFCHEANGFRRFAVDSIREVKVLDEASQAFTPEETIAAIGSGYGVFAGEAKQMAKLKFSKTRARWVAMEQWHAEQTSHTLADGSYVLEFPYADHRELLMDILKYGADVEVLAPTSLKAAVMDEIQQMAKLYGQSAEQSVYS
ncbi:YafY family transcriptional regulator [Leeia sp. TBRC 13508]|uniref:YafY family transcriptional regulator n=1 Tax=Leeia speluncae TaxID=2884804 RepID=A0ABS8D3Y7_9NEIS|nr:YafY family protein [Leeia speluncae]MCB6182373.1 YafY family transcriptional regulator [Leeia speluncae]